jgi:hypothetical protein
LSRRRRRLPNLTAPGLGRAAVIGILVTLMAGGPAANYVLAKRPTKPPKLPTTMLPLHITEVVVRNGELVALGTLGSHTFESPVTLTAQPNPSDPSCPILDIALGEIHLQLLGLNVDTSEICVDVIAHAGGGLLGDLLCAVANLLADGLSLGDILNLLTAADVATLLDAITDLLNGVLDRATAPAAIVGVSDSSPGACDILNLSLGPIDLNLLGLEVAVDDCHNGPVTIDVTAVPAGGLLGDLLCSLDDLLSGGHADQTAIAALLNQIAAVILALIG